MINASTVNSAKDLPSTELCANCDHRAKRKAESLVMPTLVARLLRIFYNAVVLAAIDKYDVPWHYRSLRQGDTQKCLPD